ncbi:MAG TPA: hypothetical protein VGR73_03565 [Bryobacteraceae bacterium]|nr:hypothetical protein [Bryobacteraceae bacterium]
MKALGSILLLTVTLSPVSAQWLDYRTPGIPRLANGKANLSAPAPRTADGKPDLSGIWQGTDDKYFRDLSADGVQIPMLPWAEKLYKDRKENLQKGHPSERCLGHGVTDYDSQVSLRRVVQAPGVMAFMFEGYNHYRQIFLDGRPLPPPTQPSYLGYSTGRWEGDTLVVETNGLNDQGWLDMNGHPQTETTHITERFRRRDFGHIDLQLTVDDPAAYTKPWSANVHWVYVPDVELIESICENEKDFQHMVGK